MPLARFRPAALALLSVSLVALVPLAAPGAAAARPDAVTGARASVPASPPSQTSAAATRDGVVPALARLPFSVRVSVKAAIRAPEGVWVISRPKASATKKGTCRLGPETGKYPTDTICTTEYGEVLLLNAARNRILRAYPMPSVPPTLLRLGPRAVYCARPGATRLSEYALPDAMVCRIDRRTLTARVHVFAAPEGSEVLQPCFYPPKGWTVTKGTIPVTDLRVDAQGLFVGAGDGRWTRLDPVTLSVVARNVRR